jgi:DNA (cytosine-5)-methyltransferase 1
VAEVRDVLEWEPGGSFDAIVGGPPCQPFSIANNRLVGERHPLYPTFPRFFDAILSLRPKVFLLENVRGLLMRRSRHHLERQLARVSGDYAVEWRILNAVDYGVPQRRERLIVVGVRRDLGRRPLFPEPTHAEGGSAGLDGRRLHRWLTLGEAIGDLLRIPPAECGGRELSFVLLREGQAERIRREREDPSLHGHWGRMDFPDRLDNPSRTLSSHTVEGTKRETIVLPVIPDHVMTEKGGSWYGNWEWGSRVMDPGKPGFTATEKHRSGQLVPVPTTPDMLGRPSPVLVADARMYATDRREHGADAEKGCYRRLTVRECLRLQSFPDWWRFPDRVSVSKRYRMVGEAVPPILAYRLGVALAKALGLRTREPPREGEWCLPYFRRAFADYLDGGGAV